MKRKEDDCLAVVVTKAGSPTIQDKSNDFFRAKIDICFGIVSETGKLFSLLLVISMLEY